MKYDSSQNLIPENQLTSSQQEAAKKLHFFQRIHSLSINEVDGVKTRPFPLLIGPSGSGKTLLANRLAVQHGLPLFSVNISNWIPRGARNESQITLDQIAAFVAEHDDGVIFIDELNKLKSRHADASAWCMDNMNEVLAFLDMDDRLENMGFENLVGKLKQDFLVIGAAAFQDEWSRSEHKPGLGFGGVSSEGTSREDAYEQLVRNQNLVADELLFRFNDRLIVIAPPTLEEFSERIVGIRRALGLSPLAQDRVQLLARGAEQSRKMLRWLEGYVSQCLAEIPVAEIQRFAPVEPLQEIQPGDEQKVHGGPSSRTTSAKAEQLRKQEWDVAFDRYDAAVQELGRASNVLGSFVTQVDSICALAGGAKGGRFETVLAEVGEHFKKDATKKERVALALRMFERLSRWCFTVGLPSTPNDERGKFGRWIESISEKLLAQIPAFQEAMCAVGFSPEISLAVAEFSTAVHRASSKYQALMDLRARHKRERSPGR